MNQWKIITELDQQKFEEQLNQLSKVGWKVHQIGLKDNVFYQTAPLNSPYGTNYPYGIGGGYYSTTAAYPTTGVPSWYAVLWIDKAEYNTMVLEGKAI